MKIVTVVGARPQFIKAATVSRIIKDTKGVEEVIVHTGQHYDKNMSQVFFEEMKIPSPHYNLNIANMGHGAMTGRMLEAIEDTLIGEKPDLVLIYGDTNSTLAGALAASKLHVPVAHVEAGLRSFNMRMPEEINRILADRISSILFCPTATAVANLRSEGFDQFKCKILNCGDVMYDAVCFYRDKEVRPPDIDIPDEDNFVLATIHRSENTDDHDRFRSLVDAMNEIHQELSILLPLHPRTRSVLDQLGISLNVNFFEPISYFEMLYLLKRCKLVMTDSGGLQKEAYFFQKPCITLRDETEWLELMDLGYNEVVGACKESIIDAFQKFHDKRIRIQEGIFGDGHAASKVLSEIIAF